MIASKQFSKKYALSQAGIKEIERYNYTRQYAYYSCVFAKKFVKDKKILEIIKYHDIAQDFKDTAKQQGNYDTQEFKKVFSNLDITLYELFLKCDKCSGKNTLSPWLKKQLQTHHLK